MTDPEQPASISELKTLKPKQDGVALPFLAAAPIQSNNQTKPPAQSRQDGEFKRVQFSLPPLSELVGERKDEITGDVQFLLDFAIIGQEQRLSCSG